MKRVVITGLGIVSCIGNDAKTVTKKFKKFKFWDLFCSRI